VLYVGRFGTRKGVRDVFEAVPGVLARVPAARFVFVGGASPADGPREAAAWVPPKLRAHLDHMAFLGWRNPWTETAKDWYVLGDVLVVPSRYEPFGMVVLEGMLRGRLVVAANTGGPSELLEHERTGLLYRAGDVDEMVDMLCRALVDRDLGRRVKRAARREVRSHWSWESVLPAVHRVYAEVAAARPTRSFAPRP
jgi:glycogen(starch) synthase